MKSTEVINGVVEPEVAVQARDGLNLILSKVEVRDLQVLQQPALGVGLGDDGQSALGGPAQENLCGGALVLLGDGSDGGVLEENGGVVGLLPVELDERLRAEAIFR